MHESSQEPLPEEPEDFEGFFDAQLSLPLPFVEAPEPFSTVIKRDGRSEPFDKRKIARAILKAAETLGGHDEALANNLAAAVTIYLAKLLHDQAPTVDQIHDAVERVLIQMAHARTALAYARYRDRRARVRRLRQGDMRALLSELEEARHEREALGGHGDAALFVRTSADTLTSWDTNRIVEALTRETELDTAMATVVALEVEKQIQQAQLRVLTTSLVRELVGAKLVEHGLEHYRARHRRLGLPLFDCERILRGTTPETVARDPVATDRVLAQAVKKEYALAEVFSPSVAEAHLRGDLHLHRPDLVDRLHSGEHALEYLLLFGIDLPGSRAFAAPPQHAHTCLAQMIKFSSMLQAHFAGPIAWDAANVYFAPFVQGMDKATLAQFAQMLVYEYAFRALAPDNTSPPAELTLCWTPPGHLRHQPTFGAAGAPASKQYGDYLHAAQQLAWAIIDIFHQGAADGIAFPAPLPRIYLGPDFFRCDGHAAWLQHVCQVAALRGNMHFLFEREAPQSRPHAASWQPRVLALQEVVLNLPRAAYATGKEGALLKALDQLLELAIEAHEEKRDFIEHLMDPAEGPLALLAVKRDGRAYVDLEQARCLIAVEGLSECVQVLLNSAPHESEEAAALGARILAHLEARCRDRGRAKHLRLCLAQNNDSSVSNRFATLDLKAFPKTAASVVRPEPGTQALRYTTGVRLNAEHTMSPIESIRIEGQYHAHLGHGARSAVPLPVRETNPASIADFLKKAWHQTRVRTLGFE